MKEGKYLRQDEKYAKKQSFRPLALMLTLMLVLGSVVGGTVAWLIADTDPVVNTFTYGDIDLKLEETDTDLDNDDDPNTNQYKMLPGEDITKDPQVTVLAGSENCWLFVKLVKSENFDDFMTYTIGGGWAQLYDAEGNEIKGVYYRFHGETTEDEIYSVLDGDMVSVSESVTKEMLNDLDDNGKNVADATYPSLTVTAYAVQYSGFEPEITEGAIEPTAVQIKAAALNAWNAVEQQNDIASPNP